jgi:hypothetical protein
MTRQSYRESKAAFGDNRAYLKTFARPSFERRRAAFALTFAGWLRRRGDKESARFWVLHARFHRCDAR